MARIPRIVAPGLPHHIVQRGSRRQRTFFDEWDYSKYLEIMSERCNRHGVEIWSYCLMPNHVHLIAVPQGENDLRKAIGEAHKRYTERINQREGWRGHLWQERFSSYVMDEKYLMATVRYIALNPVRAGIVNIPEEYPWSSAQAHKTGQDDRLVRVKPLSDIIGNWENFINDPITNRDLNIIRRHEKNGRPLGEANFIEDLEKKLGKIIRPRKRGPRKKCETINENNCLLSGLST
jgi:putative transposase